MGMGIQWGWGTAMGMGMAIMTGRDTMEVMLLGIYIRAGKGVAAGMMKGIGAGMIKGIAGEKQEVRDTGMTHRMGDMPRMTDTQDQGMDIAMEEGMDMVNRGDIIPTLPHETVLHRVIETALPPVSRETKRNIHQS